MSRYNNATLRFIDEDLPYPVALLDDIAIHFMHYRSKQDAREQWVRRVARIKYDNIFLMMTDKDGCTQENLLEFDRLPYRKVAFTHVSHPAIESAFCIPGFEKEGELGHAWQFTPPHSGEKYYDAFNYVDWLNGE